MRFGPILLAVLLVLPFVPANAESEDLPTKNASYLEAVLRARAASEGIELPDLSTLAAERTTFDSATGTLVVEQVSVADVLAQLSAAAGEVDLARLERTDVAPAGLPVVGVGDNLHLFVDLRVGDCTAPTNYRGVSAGPALPPAVVPNPAGTPVAALILWGGPAFHVRGGDWLLGAHIFVGAPVDANVNTAGPGIDLAAGLDSAIEAAGAGRVSLSWASVKIFGICLLSVDAGLILMNGALYVDPATPPLPGGV